MSITLSDEEILAITGCKQESGQEEWFKTAKIPCFPKRGGGLTVAKFWFENAPLQRANLPEHTGRQTPRLDKVGQRG